MLKESITKEVHCQRSSLPQEFITKGVDITFRYITKGVHFHQSKTKGSEFTWNSMYIMYTSII